MGRQTERTCAMSFKDVLLQLHSYPEATPVAAIEQAVGMAGALGAAVTALAVHIDLPQVGSPLANRLLDLPGMIAAERQKSEAGMRASLEAFEAAARRLGLASGHVLASCQRSQLPALVTEQARTRDLTLIPIDDGSGQQQFVAEAVIFGAGRPTLVFPAVPKRAPTAAFGAVAIAWDCSRPAARAIADALPILQRAGTVRVLTVTGEKRLAATIPPAELVRHLACHGVTVTVEEQPAAGRSIGQVLEDYAARHSLDLLVMGAFGHSRMRDFVLGGATRTILAAPPLPVFLSH